MDRKYKAFISYRHLPLDMSVAKKIHRRIEHYIIPRELRKNGVKKLGYVFRDQDELPISSNLTDNIYDALDHSEYLIVICTPETGKSQWVLREISYFLEKHDRDHVLAVLADGTPETSFPDPLTTFVSDDGSPVRIEPLAANIAADSAFKRGRLFSTESLRILAALIGCPFDSLYKREQRYKLRRIGLAAALIAAVAAVFIVTLIDRNRQIHANYEQSLRNQSQYLAAESLNSLKEGDRLSAIFLALEALPSDRNGRPLVSKAVYALGCALRVYTSPGNVSGLQASDVLVHADNVEEFRLNGTGSLLCSRCLDGSLAGWDTAGMNELWTLSGENGREYKGISGFVNGSDLVAWHLNGISRIDGTTGEKVWDAPAPDPESSVLGVFIPNDGNVAAAVCSSGVFLIDPESGAVIRSVAWPEQKIGDDTVSYNALRSQLSPDGGMLAVQISLNGKGRGIAVVDLGSGSPVFAQYYPDDCYIPGQVIFTGDGRFFYISSAMNGLGSYALRDMQAMTYSENILHCVDLDTGETLWETRHRSSSAGANDVLIYNTELLDRPILIYAYANHLDVLDAVNGEILANTEFSARIIGVDPVKSFIACVTENGERGIILMNDLSTWYSVRPFIDGVRYEKYFDGICWVIPDSSNRIIRYSPMEADPGWSRMDTIFTDLQDEHSFFDRSFYVGEGCIAFVDNNRILINDGDPGHPLRETDIPAGGSRYIDLTPLSCIDGRLALAWSDTVVRGLVYADTKTADYEVLPWADPELEFLEVRASEDDRELYALGCRSASDGDGYTYTLYALKLDPRLNILKRLEIGTFAGSVKWKACFDPCGRIYLYLENCGQCFCADLRRSAVKECGEAVDGCFAAIIAEERRPAERCCFSRDGSLFALGSGSTGWKVFSSDCRELLCIRGDSSEIVSASFTPDCRCLLTLETDGCMRRYSLSDGKLLSKNELFYENTIREYTDVSWKYTGSGFLAVRIDSYLDLVSMDDWETFAYVPSCYGFLEDRDFFVCYDYSSGDKTYAGFRRYSLEALTDYGRSILNGWDMSESQRMDYGLS